LKIGVIGGTGIHGAIRIADERDVSVKTPYGDAFMKRGNLRGVETILLYRHGDGHTVPPHKVNYRANIWALWWLGVEKVIGTAACGSLNSAMSPGDIVVVDQFLDFTRSRSATFFDGAGQGVVHTDVTDPYCAGVREALLRAADDSDVRAHSSGCYVCTEGPRFETRAEIRAFSILGGDLVGMTNVPEVTLAREAGICYGLLAIVTNFAAGISGKELSHQEVLQAMDEASSSVATVIGGAVNRLSERNQCACRKNWTLLAHMRGAGGLR